MSVGVQIFSSSKPVVLVSGRFTYAAKGAGRGGAADEASKTCKPSLRRLIEGQGEAEKVWALHAQKGPVGGAEGLRRLLLAIIRDLRVEALIGIHRRERHAKQTLSIDLDIGLRSTAVFASDKVAERDKKRWELDPASSEDYRERKK